jgi:hypothetical protein
MGDPPLASDAERAELVHAARTRDDEVIVPEGVLIELSGGGALSSQELKVEGDVRDGAPLIRIDHRGVCGSLGVRSKPRLADQLKDSWRRWAERLSEPPE